MPGRISTEYRKLFRISLVGGEHFTVDDANALIPRLEMLVERMQRAARTVRCALQEMGDEAGDGPRTTADVVRLRPDLAPVVREIEGAVGEVESLGCQFKGLDLGLVDFPTEIDGIPGLLCWQYGEKEIAYWHTPDEGFAGRRVISADDIRPLQ